MFLALLAEISLPLLSFPRSISFHFIPLEFPSPQSALILLLWFLSPSTVLDIKMFQMIMQQQRYRCSSRPPCFCTKCTFLQLAAFVIQIHAFCFVLFLPPTLSLQLNFHFFAFHAKFSRFAAHRIHCEPHYFHVLWRNSQAETRTMNTFWIWKVEFARCFEFTATPSRLSCMTWDGKSKSWFECFAAGKIWKVFFVN